MPLLFSEVDFEKHQITCDAYHNENGKADQQIADMVVIPNPATLKIRQLNLALANIF